MRACAFLEIFSRGLAPLSPLFGVAQTFDFFPPSVDAPR
jgi:hypothetical protein